MDQRELYYFFIIINDYLYDFKIIDCFYIFYFLENFFYEWMDFCGYGFRNVIVYIFVYDIILEDSFQYIKILCE